MVNFSFNGLDNLVVAVALSGGADSMALAHFLYANASEHNYTLKAVNVEHGIRGENSINDTNFVKNFCNSLNIPIKCYTVDSLTYSRTHKLTLEEGARKLRYNAFFDAIKSGFCDVILTAHHLSDNAESIILNICRGTGIKGLQGITEYENKIIRPMLNVKKEDVLDYVCKNNVLFVNDETNQLCDYKRNALRLEVIPNLKKVFPKFEESLYRLSQIAKEEDSCLEELSNELITYEGSAVKIVVVGHIALIKRAIIKAIKYLGIVKDYKQKHINAVIDLISAEVGTTLNLPKGVIAIKEYNNLALYKKEEENRKEIPFNIGVYEFKEHILVIERVESIENINLKNLPNNEYYADYDKFKESVIRTKKENDVFIKFGGGTKKIKDLLVDAKILLRKRNFLPMIALNNNILFIAEIGISNLVKIDSGTRNYIKITVQKKG